MHSHPPAATGKSTGKGVTWSECMYEPSLMDGIVHGKPPVTLGLRNAESRSRFFILFATPPSASRHTRLARALAAAAMSACTSADASPCRPKTS